MKLGLISDTHGHLDPRVAKIFAGVDHILHAGDIGGDFIIAELGTIAPVTAVLGNNDDSPVYPLTQVLTLGRLKFFVHHIVTPQAPGDALKNRLSEEQPDVVIFGHSHKQFDQSINGIWFINPGYAGKPRFNQARSVAVLELDSPTPRVRFVELRT